MTCAHGLVEGTLQMPECPTYSDRCKANDDRLTACGSGLLSVTVVGVQCSKAADAFTHTPGLLVLWLGLQQGQLYCCIYRYCLLL